MHEIVSDEPYEAGLKAGIEQDIVLKEKPTKSELQALLLSLHRKAMARKDFRYHKRPTTVLLHVWESRKNFEADGDAWLAMLQYNELSGDQQPRITICEPALAALHNPEVKFGLSEERRKEIYFELVVLQDKARSEAEAIYPEPRGPVQSEVLLHEAKRKQNDHAASRREEWEALLCKHYGITAEQLRSISLEGSSKQWPLPRGNP